MPEEENFIEIVIIEPALLGPNSSQLPQENWDHTIIEISWDEQHYSEHLRTAVEKAKRTNTKGKVIFIMLFCDNKAWFYAYFKLGGEKYTQHNIKGLVLLYPELYYSYDSGTNSNFLLIEDYIRYGIDFTDNRLRSHFHLLFTFMANQRIIDDIKGYIEELYFFLREYPLDIDSSHFIMI